MTGKGVRVLAFFVAVLFCAGTVHAETAGMEKGALILGLILKLEKMRDDAMADLRRYTNEIRKNDGTVVRAERIMDLARKKGNVKAEMIALDALGKARRARARNEELRNSARLRKARAERALADARELLARQASMEAEVRSLVTDHKGRVYVFSKRRGESLPLGEGRGAFIAPGDEIRTLGDSSAELQFLNGRGTLSLGEHTRVTMEGEDVGRQVVRMIEGRIRIAVDRVDDYIEMVEQKIGKYKSDAVFVRDEALQRLVNQFEELRGRVERARTGRTFSDSPFWPLLPGVEVRTPCAVLAERGTRFIVSEDDKRGTELIVLEGAVDVKTVDGEEHLVVEAGRRVRVSKDGVVSAPEVIDAAGVLWEEDGCGRCP